MLFYAIGDLTILPEKYIFHCRFSLFAFCLKTMKPISLHGHERSITQIVYNREGDLLFSSAKDQNPNVWYSINGERLGTYDGHGK